MGGDLRVRSLEEAELIIGSHETRLAALELELRDQAQRLDTLQTPAWRRLIFRLDGWPGIRDLNAPGPAWRPWRRWWTS